VSLSHNYYVVVSMLMFDRQHRSGMSDCQPAATKMQLFAASPS
jgi:hypothetical protein